MNRDPRLAARSGTYSTRRRQAIALLLIATCQVLRPAAAGVSPYLPLNLAPALEARIERLLALAGVPVMTRPIRVATVQAALPVACRRDRALCQQVRRYLAPYQQAAAITGAGVEGAGTDRNALRQPNQHGAPMNTPWQAYAAGQAHFGDHLLIGVGGLGYQGRFTPTGTLISAGGDRLQLDLGYRDHAWSPLRLGNMLMGTEAATMPSATISNALPLTRAHLHYELFLARMSHSNRIDFNGTDIAGYPMLFGFHVDAEPAPGWSLGVSRLMQYGGGARPHGFKDLLKAFVNATKYDNTGRGIPTGKEFGNQQFAVSSALVLPVRMPISLFIEYAAEDTFHAENYRFGSSAISGGFFLPQLRPGWQLRYEFSEWQSNWYVHHIYQDGMSNFGATVGNWAADWRRPGDGVGGQSHALQLSWDRADGQLLDLQYRTALNASYTGGHYQRGHDLNLSLSRPWRSLQIGARVEGGRDEFGERFGRIAAFANFMGAPQLAPSRQASDGAAGTDDAGGVTDAADADVATAHRERRSVEGFVDVGMFSAKRNLEYDAGAVAPVKTPQGSVHLGLGVRRAYNRRNDFGTRIEFDNVRGRLFTALRALDYRHHFGPTAAGSLFLGVARYDGPTPAYGWYGGAGLQWMNVFRNWDLGVDYRVGDHMVRNKNLPGDTTQIYPNAFYSIKGESLYISRRF